MRISIISDDGAVLVDGVSRKVDLAALAADVHAVQWDSAAGKGWVEFKTGSGKANAPINSFSTYQAFYDAWVAKAIPASPGVGYYWDEATWSWVFDQSLADATARDAGYDSAITSDSTIQQLKAMTSAQFDAWWDANVTTSAQAIAVLKRIARVIIRKVL